MRMTEKSLSDLRHDLVLEKSANKLILLAMLLNSADTFFTSLALDYGASELNPIMAATLQVGMSCFLFSKLIVANLLILFVGLVGRKYSIGRNGMMFLCFVYSLLCVYHLLNLSHLAMIGT